VSSSNRGEVPWSASRGELHVTKWRGYVRHRSDDRRNQGVSFTTASRAGRDARSFRAIAQDVQDIPLNARHHVISPPLGVRIEMS
jgi:hypothetical protein